eukprot:GFYU01003413.1.p1 GENE.GFYU01003413.1~~GFYU01003413.1.p1  ORF type:complete len:701 (-),score=178.20 GFYU01003413.1:100-2202(-)
MARHRNIRNMDYSDYMDEDDYYDSPYGSYGSEGGYSQGSPSSPSMSSYMWSGNTQAGLDNFLESQSPSKSDGAKSRDSDDPEAIGNCVSELYSLFEDKFTEAEMIAAARACHCNAEEAADWLIEKATSGKRGLRSPGSSPLGPKGMSSPGGPKGMSITLGEAKPTPPKDGQSSSGVVAPPTMVSRPLKQPPPGFELTAGDAHKDEIKSEDPVTPSKPQGDRSLSPKRTPTQSVDAVSSSMSATRISPTTQRTVPKYKKSARPKEIEEAMKSEVADKERLNMICIGHVDAGKSTLMGHLLFKLGEVNKKQMHKFEKESKEMGKASFAFAWIMDENDEERSRGVTMDVGITQFETPTKRVTLLDAPGHKDFIPNMIAGAAQADVAVLVVDASPGEFETGFESGGQTKEHAMLVRSLGVTEIVVAVNKLDQVGWDKQRFDFLTAELTKFLKLTGFRESSVKYVPVSGLTGVNIQEKKEPALSWYTGPTLLEAVDAFTPPVRETDKPFRLCVNDIYKSLALGMSVGGKIETGNVVVKDKLLVMPVNEIVSVKGIEVQGDSCKWGKAGDNVSLGIEGIEPQQIWVGSILCDPEKPISIVSVFKAQIVTLQLSRPFTLGYQVNLHSMSLNEPAHLSRLVSIIDKTTGEVKKRKPRCVTKNTTAVVEITVGRPVCVEEYKKYRALGRFMLREGGETLAVGIIQKIIA